MTLSLNKPGEGNTDWASPINDNWTDIENSLPAAKGQLVSGDTNGDPTRLSVGADGTVLTADSAEATGLKWATPSSGGITDVALQVFTGSGTYTPTSGMTKCLVFATGGGGGGGGADGTDSSCNAAGGGGGAGGTAIELISAATIGSSSQSITAIASKRARASLR